MEDAYNEYAEYSELCKNNPHDRLELAKVLREMGEIKVELKDYAKGFELIKRYLNSAKSLGDDIEIQASMLL